MLKAQSALLFTHSLRENNWITSRPVAIPRLKSPVCPIIYSKLRGEELDSYLSQEY